MRLAWFSPWPPQVSGVAVCSTRLTTVMAARGHAIDVFVDRRSVPGRTRWAADGPSPGDVRVQSAHDFVWRQFRQQYDLVVYQVGNSIAHAYLWPYLLRYPGVAILHDAHLHHSRGAALITPASAAAYRAAFAADHPDVNPDVAELAIAGFDGAYYYNWPMVASAIRGSRAVGVHARGSVDRLREAHPEALIDYVALGMGRDVPVSPETRARTRARLGIAEGTTLFGVFGGLTRDKHIPEILDAFLRLRRLAPRTHLLLAGRPDPALRLPARLESVPPAAVTVAPDLDDQAFEEAIAATDVVLSLRWPTAREVSGPWLHALAAGRPTITLDLAHATHVPALDSQTWSARLGTGAGAAVTVAINILDETRSLDRAMARLATDAALRARLGDAARAWWQREHTIDRMADDYERLLDKAGRVAAPAVALPPALGPDPLARTRALVEPFGDLTCTLF